MILSRWVIITLIFGFLSTSCTHTPYNPFKIERQQIFDTIKTMAMMPMDLSKDVPNSEAVMTRYESLISTQLQKAGFKIIPSKEYSSIYDPMVSKVGGFFDPITGKANEEKLKSVRDHSMRELQRKHSVDALVYPRVIVVAAKWFGGTAVWDGVKESTTRETGIWGFLNKPDASGTIGALSLAIFITDTNETTYYANSGGIQLIQKLEKGGFLEGYQFVDVQSVELFVEQSKDSRAVQLALDALVTGPEKQGENK